MWSSVVRIAPFTVPPFVDTAPTPAALKLSAYRGRRTTGLPFQFVPQPVAVGEVT